MEKNGGRIKSHIRFIQKAFMTQTVTELAICLEL